MECFLSAFENYFVKMPTDYHFYHKRWKAAGVRYDLSYGMFDSNKLVGFIINAIGQRQDDLTAYNSGTGIIPEYRGQRIVKSIYNYAIPQLVKNGVTKCQLEVITKNEKAIKSYQGIGFKICKRYKCYKGTLSTDNKKGFVLNKFSYKAVDWDAFPNQDLYSWDNQKESLVQANYECYQVQVEGQLQSYFIMDSQSGYIAQFEVLEDSVSQWQNLFSAIQSINQDVRINNIDNRLTNKIRAVKAAGLESTIDQFEMELYL
nr:GNAT family N-acetyltransferase [Winogradskyella luteola]